MKKDLQKELDIKKWLESEQAQKDLCSSYDFCIKCDKKNTEPCAMAYKAFHKKERKPVLSFSEKLTASKEITKERYAVLCEGIKQEDIKLRVCKRYVTLRSNRILVGLITLTKNSLKLHLALDPTLREEIPHLDYSDKLTYADCPFTIRISSKKAIKQSISLLSEIKKGL